MTYKCVQPKLALLTSQFPCDSARDFDHAVTMKMVLSGFNTFNLNVDPAEHEEDTQFEYLMQ